MFAYHRRGISAKCLTLAECVNLEWASMPRDPSGGVLWRRVAKVVNEKQKN